MDKRLIIITLVSLLCANPVVMGQFSETSLYNVTKQGKILSAKGNTPLPMVICGHDNYRCSTFIVDDGSQRKAFATTIYNPNITPDPTRIGYRVMDMKMLDNMCWFSGEKWIETGNYIAVYGGGWMPEVLHYGFIGKFNVNDILADNGSWDVAVFEDYDSIPSLAVFTGGVIAIGNKQDYTQIIDLQETDWTSIYLGVIGQSTYSTEYFKDVEWVGGKVVVLSRFKSGSLFPLYDAGFALRYGNPTNFMGTAGSLYIYNASSLWSSSYYGRFSGLDHPIFLSGTNTGNGVQVYHIPPQGNGIIKMLVNTDGSGYSGTKDIRFDYGAFTDSPQSHSMEEVSVSKRYFETQSSMDSSVLRAFRCIDGQ